MPQSQSLHETPKPAEMRNNCKPNATYETIDAQKNENRNSILKKGVREKSRECHNHKPQPFPDTKRKRKHTKPNKRKSNKRKKSTKTSSLFPKRGNRNPKRTEKHKNKITQARHETNRLVE